MVPKLFFCGRMGGSGSIETRIVRVLTKNQLLPLFPSIYFSCFWPQNGLRSNLIASKFKNFLGGMYAPRPHLAVVRSNMTTSNLMAMAPQPMYSTVQTCTSH